MDEITRLRHHLDEVREERRDFFEQTKELQAIIRAKNRLEQAMYDSDSEASWPKEAGELERAYQQRYGVDLSGVEQAQ